MVWLVIYSEVGEISRISFWKEGTDQGHMLLLFLWVCFVFLTYTVALQPRAALKFVNLLPPPVPRADGDSRQSYSTMPSKN